MLEVDVAELYASDPWGYYVVRADWGVKHLIQRGCVWNVVRSSNHQKFLGYFFNLRFWGCHRLPERSFFFRGKQFPVCARCTGVFIGQILMIILVILGMKPSWIVSLSLLGIMFLDWFIQYLNILKSTNIRRLITGTLGGMGLIGVYYLIIKILFNLFI